MKLVCFHLFNDYSGSPTVLKSVLQNLLEKGFGIDLVTSKGGVLDKLNECGNIKFSYYSYHFSANAAVTMIKYFLVQIYTFFLSFRYIFKRDTVFYINTLLPVGPALAGRIMCKKVVYHYHENAFVKGLFYKVLCKLMQVLATEIICVSEYQRSFLKRKKNITVVPNSVQKQFLEKLKPCAEHSFITKTVLMLGSLKTYKGTIEFIEISKKLNEYKFVLVINDTQENIDNFLNENDIIKQNNLILYPRQNDVSRFYNSSSIVLNLSNKNLFIETFGLTALEAMSAGLPVIVPTVGGIAEMVEDGVNGYKIDVQEFDKISQKIKEILSNKELYMHLSKNALEYSKKFNSDKMIEKITACLF